jgi:hypothetical protein
MATEYTVAVARADFEEMAAKNPPPNVGGFRDLPPNTIKLVAFAIASLTTDEGDCFFGPRLIAKMTHLDETTAKAATLWMNYVGLLDAQAGNERIGRYKVQPVVKTPEGWKFEGHEETVNGQ